MLEYKTEPDDEDELTKLLHPLVHRWFVSQFPGFSLPQRFGVMEIHSRKNVLISAPTGATKTLTGFLAIINELVDSAQKGILEDKVYCIYISPLKALNYDIQQNLLGPMNHINELNGEDLGIRIMVRTGDTTASERAKMAKNPPHILITTPESLAIMLNSFKFNNYLQSVDWCIIDEIHAMADNKRGVHLNLSIERLNHRSPQLARIGLSATVAPIEEVAYFMAGDRDVTIIDVNFIKQTDIKVITPFKNMLTEGKKIHSRIYELLHEQIKKHKTTLIFTNTRSATERVVYKLKDLFPDYYSDTNIGAHHGSLDKKHRRLLEDSLRHGRMKAVVCSTSLELGIDIGFVDLVICLSSPKSVARTLQRIGRSGHRLSAVTKGRLLVTDNDDLIECSVLVHNAVNHKIDRIHVPKNALDVLTQHVFGMALERVWDQVEMYEIIKKSYCYKTLSYTDFVEVLEYLAGEHVLLEDRYIYAKIWRKDGKIGRKGKMAKVIYMTNIGTIPDQGGVVVKTGSTTIGSIDEAFLEKMRSGDIFVLGGVTYQFKHSRGMVAQVERSPGRSPTVPSWYSDMLPLSFDLASAIGMFRRLVFDRFNESQPKEEIVRFIREYLNSSDSQAYAIYNYLAEQYDYIGLIPNDKLILVEHYHDDKECKVVFHTMFGRRVNDVLSRALAFAVSRVFHKDVQIGINDNGFYIIAGKNINVMRAFKFLHSSELRSVLSNAIENTEVFKRRFRHCAGRSLMILRNYKGNTKPVGRQQISSMILLNAVRRISNDFFILRETRREVLEDLMDINNATRILQRIEAGTIKIEERHTQIPSPLALNIVLMSHIDILKIDDRVDFLKRMHSMIQAKIALDQSRKGKPVYHDFTYENFWDKQHSIRAVEDEHRRLLLEQLSIVDEEMGLPSVATQEIKRVIKGKRQVSSAFLSDLDQHLTGVIPKTWPKDLADFLRDIRPDLVPK